MPNWSGIWDLSAVVRARSTRLWPQQPGAPTSVSATAGDEEATVTFTAPTDTGVPAGITGYKVISDPGSIEETGSSSPITVTGLTNGTSYTFTVQATNGVQYGAAGGPSGSVTPALLERAVFAGGRTGTYSNVIDYVEITTTGNATDFGDLIAPTYGYIAGCSSLTRGLFGGGATSTGTSGVNTIQYITIGSTGNATDFGDLGVVRRFTSACSSGTRGVWSSGLEYSTPTNSMEYVTIASTGNGTDFGDATLANYELAGCASPTRGIFAGGTDFDFGTARNDIQYITLASTGNATDFGNLEYAKGELGACSSNTRAVFGGGTGSFPLSMSYITIASTGNSTNFGDLNYGGPSPNEQTATSSSTRGLFGGGTGPTNVINYITIATTGNSSDFGDLTVAREELASCSSAHGGLA